MTSSLITKEFEIKWISIMVLEMWEKLQQNTITMDELFSLRAGLQELGGKEQEVQIVEDEIARMQSDHELQESREIRAREQDALEEQQLEEETRQLVDQELAEEEEEDPDVIDL